MLGSCDGMVTLIEFAYLFVLGSKVVQCSVQLPDAMRDNRCLHS